MARNLSEKIISEHLVDGDMVPGEEIAIRIDQTLLQDATGTMVDLQFEALDIPRVKTKLSVCYVDHNMLQAGFENADDHRFLQTFASKYGMYFSKPGNGICHQVNLERFTYPGRTLIGSDSHTPTSGAAGMLAIGTGGLDVAVVMAGAPYYLKCPLIVGVKLTGKLKPWVTAKDVILELLRRLSVKGGLGKIMEFYGDGIKTLSVPERATITNMGAELGATTSIFPSDEVTREYFIMQDRLKDWKPLSADKDAEYDEYIEINLSELEPLIACPSSPDNVKKVTEVEGIEVQQVEIGSCNNSGYKDMMITAKVLKEKFVHPNVSFHVVPGSRQVLETIARNGALADIVASGARIMETACDGCIGMGCAPASDSVSVRSFNRNWPGRSGTVKDQVYLCSPEVCLATALSGEITDPRKLGQYPKVEWPKKFAINDSLIIPPAKYPEKVKIIRGPNIKPLPRRAPLEDCMEGVVLIHVGDNISTDAIMPAGAKILPLRSNIPAISEHVFEYIDQDFVKRAKEKNGGFIVGGDNYGQGSSREHAALAPMYLGIKAVFVKSFARIHKSNLINFGILPLEFVNPDDYEKINQGSKVEIKDLKKQLQNAENIIRVKVDGRDIEFKHDFTERHKDILIAGGLLNYIKKKI